MPSVRRVRCRSRRISDIQRNVTTLSDILAPNVSGERPVGQLHAVGGRNLEERGTYRRLRRPRFEGAPESQGKPVCVDWTVADLLISVGFFGDSPSAKAPAARRSIMGMVGPVQIL